LNAKYPFVLLLLPLLVAGWGSNRAAAQDGTRLAIVATTTQVRDALTMIGGEYVHVTGLMGAGVDPHLYKPTEANIAAMNSADAVFYSGLHLEGQFDEVFKALGERSIRTFAVSDPVKRAGFTIGGFNLSQELTNVDDPHFWFDPRNWQMSVTAMGEALALLDPAHAETYLANAEAYNAQLDLLFEWASEAMAQVPESQRVLVTSHDAFNYFGQAFGWEVRGLQGLSTQDEAGVADVQDLVNFVIERNIPVMFIESSVPPNAIEAVQEAARARGHAIGIGVRELYSDAMGAPDTFGGTYVGMLAENVITILVSFDVAVPAWPDGLEPVPPAALLDAE
jgi:manganese/zinc/iron transport system substrate-binding protein